MRKGAEIVRRLAPLAAFVPFVAVTGFGGSVAAHSASASCTSDIQRVEGGAPGPLQCSANGTKAIVVARRTPLALSSMRVSVTKTRTTPTLSNIDDGTTISHATAKGVFVVVTIRIANDTHKPQSFDNDGQVELGIKTDDYSTSLAGTVADPDTETWDNDIEPGESSTGDVVFDVPKSALALFPKHAALDLVNFGDDLTFGSVSEVGVIYLGP